MQQLLCTRPAASLLSREVSEAQVRLCWAQEGNFGPSSSSQPRHFSWMGSSRRASTCWDEL